MVQRNDYLLVVVDNQISIAYNAFMSHEQDSNHEQLYPSIRSSHGTELITAPVIKNSMDLYTFSAEGHEYILTPYKANAELVKFGATDVTEKRIIYQFNQANLATSVIFSRKSLNTYWKRNGAYDMPVCIVFTTIHKHMYQASVSGLTIAARELGYHLAMNSELM